MMLQRKVCILGAPQVGKTCLMRRFVYQFFDQHYIATTGIRVNETTVALSQGEAVTEVTMMIWDVPNHRKLEQIWSNSLRGAAGGILVCDLSQPTTIEDLAGYADALRRYNLEAQLVIAANKVDLVDNASLAGKVAPALSERLQRLAAGLNVPVYFTSAKTGAEVETLFHHIGRVTVP